MMSESVRLASFGTSVSLIGTRLSGKMLLHTCSIFFNNLWIPHVERPWNFRYGNIFFDGLEKMCVVSRWIRKISQFMPVLNCVDGDYMMLD